ncbi:hypothetical protein LCGC14_1843810 [marine sediment metagenome]|uniref:Uncharacterized protein n=1 Tax=marine sediment metagenome TaxID=412755 RepID=A0A0F9GCE7_9ZZZZ
MTDFGNWIRSQGNALLFDNDLANLAAQLEEALGPAPHGWPRGTNCQCPAHAALAACKEFQERYD